MKAKWVLSLCDKCGRRIEFDGAPYVPGEIVAAQCPHCGDQTGLAIPMPLKSLPFPARTVAKYVLIIWTLLCGLGFTVFCIVRLSPHFKEMMNDSYNQTELGMRIIALIIAGFFAFLVWAVVAIPVTLIWVVTKKEKPD